MRVPKLVREVSDASWLAWFASVDCSLSCKQHDEQAELGVESYLGQSSQVVLGQACEILESAEHSFDCNAFPIGSSELLRMRALLKYNFISLTLRKPPPWSRLKA